MSKESTALISEKNLSFYFKWPAFIAILLFPVLSLSVHNVGNACLFFLFVLAIIAGACRYKPMDISFSSLLRSYWPLHLAMVSLVIAVLLNQFASGKFAVKYYDTAFRIALFTPVLWIVLGLPLNYLKKMQWAFVAGVLIALVKIYIITAGGTLRPGNIGFLATIPFSDVVLLFGFIGLISIGWNTRQEKLAIALKVLTCCASIYVTILSQTRGSWIAIPVFAITAFLFLRNVRIRYRLAILILSLATLVTVFTNSDIVKTRLAAAKSDMTLYVDQDNADTSLGVRLQLWRASWQLFKENPVFGVGRENFSDGLEALSARDIITPVVTSFSHSHNEILFNTAILGIFGLLGILSIYFVPGYYFIRDIRHSDSIIRTAAGMGLTLCLGFFVFGLTDMMFFWSVLGGVYSMSVAAFFACIIKRKKELKAA
ncbi:O-antigen ligase [Collimonas sp. PA-H2]|uniref:O-antigen ligase family protein n=1 Tax=Collimonas sp. PA-H2 TaxID=1881062 RepID=UPI000BF76B71|nr:O-antigen ligase family protein [Collimonas sp. PA-H2]PFH10908.1 O-antigen ligase [Collimonas sp. PA-H2]